MAREQRDVRNTKRGTPPPKVAASSPKGRAKRGDPSKVRTFGQRGGPSEVPPAWPKPLRRGEGPTSRATPLREIASRVDAVLEEVRAALGRIDPRQVDGLARAILKAKRVYLAGAGRSGLVGSCFAMRLVHLGLVAHVVGEATAPGLGRGDLLVVSTGSGRTRTVLAQAQAAKERHAKVAAVTAAGRSPVARAADVVVEIPCPPFAKPKSGTGPRTVQPGGTLFEQSLLVFYDALILDLADRLDWSPKKLKLRHSNLE